ncbi:MAG: hypothetical protein ACHREM_21490, partial [Polyangiales bacterium]
ARERLHALIGIVVCVVIPASSRLFDDGALAWPMYTQTAVYRLRIIGRSTDRPARWVAPAALAARATPRASWLFGGADTWHHGDGLRSLRRRLAEIGRLACDVDASAETIDVRLEDRAAPDATISTQQESVRCLR